MRRAATATVAMLAIWMVIDLSRSVRHDLRDFDPHEVARLETDMWRSYYQGQRLRLFSGLATLLRRQYHLPFWQSTLTAYYGARAAVMFQRGRERPDYLLALPNVENFYGMIRRASVTPFDARRAAELELEWWIVHRQREQHEPGDLARGLAELQGALFRRPAADFAVHANLRAEAMLLRDRGGDWGKIAELLDRSWTSLWDVVNSGPHA